MGMERKALERKACKKQHQRRADNPTWEGEWTREEGEWMGPCDKLSTRNIKRGEQANKILDIQHTMGRDEVMTKGV